LFVKRKDLLSVDGRGGGGRFFCGVKVTATLLDASVDCEGGKGGANLGDVTKANGDATGLELFFVLMTAFVDTVVDALGGEGGLLCGTSTSFNELDPLAVETSVITLSSKF
tara:strand:- start:32 stop:364 length:333 start_codon:yes stop_codon:yes gene_type:complete